MRLSLGSRTVLMLVAVTLATLLVVDFPVVTEGRTIYYNPANRSKHNETNTSTIFVAPLHCPAGYGLDRFKRCRKLIYCGVRSGASCGAGQMYDSSGMCRNAVYF
ncbi:hypothetical protein pipiens_003683 [Culex pipiens pipiens]|uniref:Chitin-binding type-2 domain-containing protein n=1 Tax=Culex pipiens pipiens TaxID=38569 RepID=A0ABD1CU52_CULPP